MVCTSDKLRKRLISKKTYQGLEKARMKDSTEARLMAAQEQIETYPKPLAAVIGAYKVLTQGS